MRPAQDKGTRWRVALPADWDGLDWLDLASELGPDVHVDTYRHHNMHDLSEPECVDALVVGSTIITEETFTRLPNLRVISVPGTGVWDSIDLVASTQHGVVVCNVRDYAGDAVAEFTIGLMIVLSRRMLGADCAVRAGRWDDGAFVGEELRGRVLGIVGFGSIGRRVAALAQAIGMEVLVTPSRRAVDEGQLRTVATVSLNTLLRRSDTVSLHASLNDETRGLIGRAQFAHMKPTALLINTARGALVDHQALVDALRSGTLAGAALDVVDPEPLPVDHPLAAMPNVVLTPHIAARTHNAQSRAFRQCLRNVRQFLAGRPQNVVNLEVLGS